MQLEDVKALRDDLLLRLQLRPQPRSAPSIGMRRRATSPTAGAPLALGVAAGREDGDYKLAVRVQGDPIPLRGVLREVELACDGEIEVQEIGVCELRSSNFLGMRARPLTIGSSVSRSFGQTGTLGLFVLCRHTGERLILSNSHILGCNESDCADFDVFQPGVADHGSSWDRIARFSRSHPIVGDGRANLVDAAVAVIDEAVLDRGNLLTTGLQITSIGMPPAPGTKVVKQGRSTGVTTGHITAHGLHNLSIAWGCDKTFRFDHCIEIKSERRPFSASGDSGSVVAEHSGAGIGLVFAGSRGILRDVTYANELTMVMDRLQLMLPP